ncbi:KICSTOR subunit 2 isoform X2 [Anabrus simplex]|uniref:KICSTOR subunit 2 isoform X2 n=1 Tax=Anabrus simplex TaxID=316456 RepID=UPI0034DD2830
MLIFDQERERESSRASGVWGMLLTYLPQIAMAERSYVDLGFLVTKNKGFLRKDNSLRSVYDSLRGDFHRLEEVARLSGSDRTIMTVANQLCQFITARIELIDFYEKMHIMGTGKQMKYEELLSQIEDIMDKHALSFPNIALTSIKAALSLECEILAYLLRAQLEMQLWRFLQSLMQLHGAHTRISAWERTLQSRESWKLGFGATFLKANPVPALFQWLLKLKAAFVAKFSLYFFSTLAQQTTIQEMKALGNKLSNDYYHKIQSFQKRYDATAVMLVFDAHELEDFIGPGYHHPKKPVETPQGLDCYPIMFSYPIKPLNHMPNVVQIITERASELSAMDRVVFSFSQRDQSTYILSRIDPRVTFVVVFDTKKGEKESYITTFVYDLSLQLRCNKVFANLKMNTK